MSSENPIHIQLSDSELMQRVVQQEQSALLTLYARYGDAVYSLALRILNDPGQAEEITQDTFLKVWHQAEKWDPDKGKLGSWLLTIARNTAIDRYRKQSRRPALVTQSLEEVTAAASRPAQVGTVEWANGQLLRSLLAQLPAEQRQAIELAFYQGMTHSELAQALELPLGTVKTRLRLGMQKLRVLWQTATEAPRESRPDRRRNISKPE